MLRNMASRALLLAGVFLAFVALPLFGQGISGNEYTGLDKYPSQGIPKQSSEVGVRAAEFLTIPVGARGIGLGDAYSAVCDDITAIWWNPAGLGFLDHKEVMFTIVDYTLDVSYSYAAAAVPLSDGRLAVGAFFGYLDIPQEEYTSITSPNGSGSFYNAYDFQMGGSFAYHLSDRFIAGLNLKYVHQDFAQNYGASAFAIDAGGIYHTEAMGRELKFAFSIQNLGTNLTFGGTGLWTSVPPPTMTGGTYDIYSDYSDNNYAMTELSWRQAARRCNTYRLPTVVKIALAYNLYTNEKSNWLASTELWRNSNIPISYALGTEYTYNFTPFTSAAVRWGWKIQNDEVSNEGETDLMGYGYWGENPTLRGISAGGGVRRAFSGRYIEFNYAYQNKGRLSADNYYTITFGF